MCCVCSICWLLVLEGGKLVCYNLGVTNFCWKTPRSREIHIIGQHRPWCGVTALLWCFSAWLVLGCHKPPLKVPLQDPPLSYKIVSTYVGHHCA